MKHSKAIMLEGSKVPLPRVRRYISFLFADGKLNEKKYGSLSGEKTMTFIWITNCE